MDRCLALPSHPERHLASTGHPLACVRSTGKVDQALATSGALREIGVRAELIDSFSYKSHAAIAREFGLQNDLPTEQAWRSCKKLKRLGDRDFR